MGVATRRAEASIREGKGGREAGQVQSLPGGVGGGACVSPVPWKDGGDTQEEQFVRETGVHKQKCWTAGVGQLPGQAHTLDSGPPRNP